MISSISRSAVLLSVLLVCSLGAAACSSSSPSGSPGDVGAPAAGGGQPKAGGELKTFMGVGGLPDTDPHMSACCASYWPHVSLRAIGLDPFTLELKPEAVEKWEVGTDSKSYTFTVRQGIKFHNVAPVNGRETTAEDIAYSLRRVAGKENPKNLSITNWPRSSVLSSLENAVAVDKTTVKVTTTRADAGFLLGVADVRNSIVAKEVVDKCGGDLRDTGNCTIGVGPYQLTEYEQDVRAVFKRHPDFYDKPKPYIDGIRYIGLADKATQLAALRAGQLDLYAGLNVLPRDVEDVKRTTPNIQLHKYFGACCGNLGWGFMVQKKPMDDLRVRKALHLMLDRDALANTWFGPNTYGEYWVYATPVSPLFKDFALPQEEMKKLPGYRQPKDEDFKEAKRLLAEAGYPKGLTVVLDSSSQSRGIAVAYAEAPTMIEEQFKRNFSDLPDMKVVWKGLEGPLMSKANVEFGHENSYWWSYAYEMDPGLQLHLTYACKGGRNYSQNCDDKWMQMWDAQQQEFDPAKRKQKLQELQRYTIDQVWRANGWESYLLMLYQPHVRGVAEWTGAGGGNNQLTYVQNWWMEK